MSEKYWRRKDNTYWGSAVGSDEAPLPDLIEVPFPPDTHATQTWNGEGWDPYVPVIPFRETLAAQFGAMVAENKQGLSDEQLASILTTASVIDNSFEKYQDVLGTDHKRAVLALVDTVTDLPPDKEPLKQALKDFINQGYN